jgi:hypothetical protein
MIAPNLRLNTMNGSSTISDAATGVSDHVFLFVHPSRGCSRPPLMLHRYAGDVRDKSRCITSRVDNYGLVSCPGPVLACWKSPEFKPAVGVRTTAEYLLLHET